MHTLNRRLSCAIILFATLFTCAAPGVPKSGAFQPGTAESKQAATRAPAGAPEPVPPEKLREDFRILRGALEEGHPGIYRYTPKQEMD